MFFGLHQLQFFLYCEPTDMRKSFDGLFGIVRSVLGADPLSGDVYVFMNRRRDRLKLLVWDGDGFWIFYKRLEKGTFQLPPHEENLSHLEVRYEDLLLITRGIDLGSVRKRRRYSREALPA